MTALFEDIIFGPIHSRRLGLSLGVNLLPEHAKICNFDCIYCECGSNSERIGECESRRFADRESVRVALRTTLERMREGGEMPDVITFSGNGEPTLHPDFESIIDDTISIRDSISPNSKISVLSNATTLDREGVVRALCRVDNAIMKVDSAIEHTATIINRAVGSYSVGRVIDQLSSLGSRCIVQTMFLRGEVNGERFDNTSDDEVSAWVSAILRISPRQVMMYSLDRDTPCSGLERVSRPDMKAIASLLPTSIDISIV